LKRISGKRMCKILRDRGWWHDHTTGSHFVYRHPDFSDPIAVPVHANRDLRTGTQHNIMKQAGLTEDDL
jgi:predicted RNA binding protein YcfA (HicA-like mRNA interferase family)